MSLRTDVELVKARGAAWTVESCAGVGVESAGVALPGPGSVACGLWWLNRLEAETDCTMSS